MGFLRLWLFLLTLAAGCAVAFALLAPRGVSEELDRETDTRLERTHHAASLLLRVNARKWIDTSAQVASDAVLVEALAEATRGPTDLAAVHQNVQQRLKYFNDRMKVDLVAATDAHGRVIARVGADAAIYKDSIEGYPLVADALRGLRGDDTWSIGGKLYRVAASPVILRDHYVGVVAIGQEATAELAESMKGVLGADVVLMLRGRVLSATAQLPILDKLPVAATARAAELAHGGRSAPITIDNYAVVLGSFVGEASEHQAIFALCVPRRAGTSLQALAMSILHRDPRTLPWRMLAPVGGGTLLALLLGLLFVWRLGSRPVSVLTRQVQALSRGELQRLPETHGGRYGVLARAINTTIDRIGGRVRAERISQPPVASPVTNDSDSSRTLPRPTRTTNPPPAIALAPTLSTPPVPHEAIKLPSGGTKPPPLPSMAPKTTPMAAVHPESPMSSGEFEERKTRARDIWQGGADPGGEAILPAGPPLFSQSLTPLPPPIVATDTEPHKVEKPDVSATHPTEMPPVEPSHVRPTARAIPARGFDEQTSVQSPSEALLIASAHGTDDEIEADYRRVFDDFVASRTQCGEGLEGVTFDRFVVKLRQNRSQLIQRYGCASVRFQVYTKDGKTALKATPVT